jgi:hypothetical protein
VKAARRGALLIAALGFSLLEPRPEPPAEAPPPPAVPGNPFDALRAQNEAQGLHLHARTAMPGWLGERLDVGCAIDVLHPLAR